MLWRSIVNVEFNTIIVRFSSTHVYSEYILHQLLFTGVVLVLWIHQSKSHTNPFRQRMAATVRNWEWRTEWKTRRQESFTSANSRTTCRRPRSSHWGCPSEKSPISSCWKEKTRYGGHVGRSGNVSGASVGTCEIPADRREREVEAHWGVDLRSYGLLFFMI